MAQTTTHKEAAMPFALGDIVTYNGEPGEVTGFGSLGAVFPDTDVPWVPIVQIAHGKYRTPRHLPADVLERQF